MEISAKAADLRRLIQLAKNYSKLQIFVDDPPIILEPSNFKHLTTFNEPDIVNLFSEHYYDKYCQIGYDDLCMCMSLNGLLFYVISYNYFIVIDLFSKKLSKINLCQNWPFDEKTSFEYWNLKIIENVMYLCNNHIGSVYFMELDLQNCSVHFKSHFEFVAPIKELRREMKVAKKRMAQMDSQKFLMLVRNEENLPELELYSIFDLKKPTFLKSFKDIPHGEDFKDPQFTYGFLKGCIKMDEKSIYVINIEFFGLIQSLTIIDIETDKRKNIQLSVKLFSLATSFLMQDMEQSDHNSKSVMSFHEIDPNFEGTIRYMFRETFQVHSCRTFDYYLKGKILLMLYVDKFSAWTSPSVLIARLNIENREISRIVFDWPSIRNSNVFRSHFTFDSEGRLRLLKIEIKKEKVLFQETTICGGGVENLGQLSLMAVKCNYPKFFVKK